MILEVVGVAHVVEFLREEDQDKCWDKTREHVDVKVGGEADGVHEAGEVTPEVETHADTGEPEAGEETAVAVGTEVGDHGEADRGDEKFC